MVFVSRRGRTAAGIAVITLTALTAIYFSSRPTATFHGLPETFSDIDFWNIVTSFSENGGYFRSDNFVSNESTFQWVIPDLKKKLKVDGVYIGVGPDQNFTYMAAVRPKVAFIVDIRRQNMLLHLMYKALFELSSSRKEFLSKLFGRPARSGLAQDTDPEQLFQRVSKEAADPSFAKETVNAVLHRLREEHHFTLSSDDCRTIEYIHNAFVAGGPEIRYSFPTQYGWRRFPSYSELMLETDANGQDHSYMVSEENFQLVKSLESENRVIPIVGDFAGDRALHSIARYLKQHATPVNAFYTSNVEFYLFQSDDWRRFFNSVAELPVDRDSVFVRAYFNNYGSRFASVSSARSETYLDGMLDLINAYKSGEIHSYFDVIKRSTAP
jgi:hypothetical protein